MSIRRLVCCGLFLPLWSAWANDMSTSWVTLARADVEAAYTLLHDDHPGAVPEAGDPAFVAALAAAHAKALERAAQVTNIEGLVATLGEFGASMGDGHIHGNARYFTRSVKWTGLAITRHGADWMVAEGGDLTGARLLSCDGIPVDDLARDILHYRTNTGVEALVTVRAGWLLVDEGNPFLHRPQACVFDKDGQHIARALEWKSILRNDLLDHHWVRPYGQAGYGVRTSGKGMWIAMEQLGTEAGKVVDTVRGQADDIRRQPYVVVDLRGNSGGNDAYGRALAEAIYGEKYVLNKLGPQDSSGGGCDEVYRVSPDNIRSLATDPLYSKALLAIETAKLHGKSLAGDMKCRPRPMGGRKAMPMMRGKVYVLTDAACFSSCIGTVTFFRTLGAIQIGQPTAADTHYAEYTESVLPSGLISFSILRALAPDSPLQVGPYAPDRFYDGDMADTAALESWVDRF